MAIYLKSASLVGITTETSHRDLVKVTNIDTFDWGVGRLLDAASAKLAPKPACRLLLVTILYGSPVSGQLGRLMTGGTRMGSLEVITTAPSGNASIYLPLRLTFFDVGVEALTSDNNSGGIPSETWAFSYRKVRSSYTPISASGAFLTPIVAEFAVSNF